MSIPIGKAVYKHCKNSILQDLADN